MSSHRTARYLGLCLVLVAGSTASTTAKSGQASGAEKPSPLSADVMSLAAPASLSAGMVDTAMPSHAKPAILLRQAAPTALAILVEIFYWEARTQASFPYLTN